MTKTTLTKTNKECTEKSQKQADSGILRRADNWKKHKVEASHFYAFNP